MVGFNIYLKGNETGEDGYSENPIFIGLSYASEREAREAVAILEQVYSKGSLFIDVRTVERNLAE